MRRPAAAPAKGEGAARCVAYEAHGYKQAGQADGRADVQADGPNRAEINQAKIAHGAAQFWLIIVITHAFQLYLSSIMHSSLLCLQEQDVLIGPCSLSHMLQAMISLQCLSKHMHKYYRNCQDF